ncbi:MULTISPECIES: MucB/RseB C-terminal domain-containing protein [unclassified Alteromonas]|uniref:MucB/RseB C-terminal domain-containing protein n=1 Tax=unclassified Alteromonas TaxID=2614992 RepID=UPI000AFA8880|nr:MULTISPECIES: MucB/RseB C-terminal domain-containing protein [unclassified Alteromonas]
MSVLKARKMRCNQFVLLITGALSIFTPFCVHAQSRDSSLPTSLESNSLESNNQAKSATESATERETKTDTVKQTEPALERETNALQTPAQWLQRLQSLISSANYQVSFVQTTVGKETVPYLWRHGVLDDGTEVEQLNLQNGPGRELIRVDGIVSVFEPDTQPYSIRSRFINGPIPNILLHNPQKLLESYEFVLVGRARVAGRSAQQIRIVSRDNTRFGYQLWLDEESGMLLKLNMLDLQGALLEQIQISAFSVMASPSPYFARINPSSLPEPIMMASSQSRAHGWEVNYLPVGMKEVKRDTRRLALTGQVVEYKMYSDGLVDVSVYVQPIEDALGGDIALRNEVSTFLTLKAGKAQVTVLGEIPLQTAKAIATSISAVNNSND